jgi:HAE1 family hydrophobic/amphiphilic exporter-1
VSPGTTVADVAEVEQTDSPSQVGRVDGEAAVTVTGRITAEDITGVTNEVQTAVADLDLPGDTGVSYGGTIEQAQEGFSDLLVAMAIAVALVYLILVVFFGSTLSPLVILLSLPLTTTGAFGAMALTRTVLSIPAMLGVLLLVGIVVANAILLVDFAKQAEGRGASVDEAILEAGRARLRPVLMTASATVGALAPLALGFGSGSVLITSGLAVPVIGGLLTSTLLTLLVVPAGYSLARGATQRLTRGRKKGTGDEPPRGVLPASRKRVVDRAGIAAGGDGRQKLPEPGASEEVADPSGPTSDGTNGGRDGNDQSFELGRALGRVEVLERELERREHELAEERQRRPGGLRTLLRRR